MSEIFTFNFDPVLAGPRVFIAHGAGSTAPREFLDSLVTQASTPRRERHRSLLAWRVAHGTNGKPLSQEQAVARAREVGIEITQEQWSRIESGKRKPSIEVARGLAKLTGVALSSLLKILYVLLYVPT